MINASENKLKIVLVVLILLISVVSYGVFAVFISTNEEPEASISTNSPNYEKTIDNVTISAEDSTDPEGGELTYSFDINNDGVYEVRESSSPTHQPDYSSEGAYVATVRVEDPQGKNDTISTAVRVNEAPEITSFNLSNAPKSESNSTFGVNTMNLELVSTENLRTLSVNISGENIEKVLEIQDFNETGNNTYVSSFDVDTLESPEITARLDEAIDAENASFRGSNISDVASSDISNPSLLSANPTLSTRNITVLVSDNQSGINDSTIQASDFSLRSEFGEASREKNISSISTENMGNGTIEVKVTTESEIIADRMSVTVENASIEDNLGNSISRSRTNISEFDIVAPEVTGTQIINKTSFRILMSDDDSGLNQRSVSKDRLEFDVDVGFSLSDIIRPEERQPYVRINFVRTVDSERTTMRIENFSDAAGNSKNLTTEIDIPDGVSPTVDDAVSTQNNNILLQLSDDGSGVNMESIAADDFRVQDASIDDITKNSESEEVEIVLSSVESSSLSISLVGNISDNAGNTLSEYNDAVLGFDTSS
jgi:hypothetical protein